jgi:catechol 2,3-dioxygenase-like lactoylglutathione lyase family enzyme
MRIHHVTVPAYDPERVARVLAELLGARVIPIAHHDALIVYAGDTDGTAIEVWPVALRVGENDDDLALRDLPLPDAWPHHAYVSTDASDSDRILAIFAREGWHAEMAQNGPPGVGFGLVRGRIENHTAIEIVGTEMRGQYERSATSQRGPPRRPNPRDRLG